MQEMENACKERILCHIFVFLHFQSPLIVTGPMSACVQYRPVNKFLRRAGIHRS